MMLLILQRKKLLKQIYQREILILKTDYKIIYIDDYEKWSCYCSSVKKSNLSQSWHYGEAKIQSQSWKILRGIITENEEPIALVQAWYKKILFLKFVRISYGPLWIIENPTLQQIKAVFQVIKNQWGLKKLALLSIGPNLENTSENNAVLKKLRFYKRKSMAFESGLTDLTPTESDLRSALRKNWRRHLNASEKMGLTYHVSKDYSDFQWMISCFEKLRNEKNFLGHPIPLLNALYGASFDIYETSAAIVTHNNEKIAGILISHHGSSCTPLVSWLSDNGRSLHAGNFLLWNSILYAKNKGCLWFDLGGTNNSTAFKTGLPHTPYQMIGEYYSSL